MTQNTAPRTAIVTGAGTGIGRATALALLADGWNVTLDAMYVEGLVHITELGGEYYKFDEARQELRGERTGIRYAIGARVRVQVSRVDLDGRKIDFRLVREGEELVGRALKDKGVSQDGPGGSGKGPRKGGANAGRAGGGRSKAKAPEASATEMASLTRERAARSPIQELKASVKKAAGGKAGGKGRKPRRG